MPLYRRFPSELPAANLKTVVLSITRSIGYVSDCSSEGLPTAIGRGGGRLWLHAAVGELKVHTESRARALSCPNAELRARTSQLMFQNQEQRSGRTNFDFWETPFGGILARLVGLIVLGVSELVGKLRC